jgi:hypothetical protein
MRRIFVRTLTGWYNLTAKQSWLKLGGRVNAFNRIVMSLVILVLFFVVTVGLIALPESLRVIQGAVGGTLHTLDRIRPELILPFRALLVLVAMLVDVLLVGLLVLEIRGPAKHHVRIKKVGGGEVVVTTESIVERLQYQIDQLADVVSVKVQVKPRGGGVELDLHVQTGADVNVPEKAEQVLEVARQVVEDKLGLVLAHKPRVSIHAMPTPGLAVRSASNSPALIPPAPNKP